MASLEVAGIALESTEMMMLTDVCGPKPPTLAHEFDDSEFLLDCPRTLEDVPWDNLAPFGLLRTTTSRWRLLAA